LSALAQATTAVPSANQPAAAPALPIPTQVKKTVVFLRTDCLHDFGADLSRLTDDALQGMPQQQAVALKGSLISLITRLQLLPESVGKLNPGDRTKLRPGELSGLDVRQLEGLVVKMTELNSDELARLSPPAIDILPVDSSMGTGFFVSVYDDRVLVPAGTDPKSVSFHYLVTNRHVVQPGIEDGRPCKRTVEYWVLVNRKTVPDGRSMVVEPLRMPANFVWYTPEDQSVDLAIAPFPIPSETYDYITIPETEFVTREAIDQRRLVEGDPLLFCGLFIQSFKQAHRLEPIVRSGTLAMIPNGPMETTLHRPGNIYLAEAHAFGGNSGSPVLIDQNKFANIISGPSYKLFGVISGEVLESADFTLQVTTSYNGQVGANSDVSIVVPTDEIVKMLHSPPLQAQRDAYIASQKR
jgi:hypothetical protein